MTDMGTIRIDRLEPQHVPRLRALFAALPAEELTLVKEDVRSADFMPAPAAPDSRTPGWVAVDGDTLAGYAALLPLLNLSNHVGELRLVVAGTHRRRGIGRLLTMQALHEARERGMTKVVVEVPAEEQATADVFCRLGFEGEALLRDHVRDRQGVLHDVLMLAHFAEDNASALAVLGADQPG